MSHTVRSNAGKNINLFFELFIKQKIEFEFVLFSMVQTLFRKKPVKKHFCNQTHLKECHTHIYQQTNLYLQRVKLAILTLTNS